MAFLINRHKEHAKIETTKETGGGARFTKGSTMKHVVSASLVSAIGLVALFVVDLVDIFFFGLLGEQELAAAVGFSGALGFFTMSIGMASVIAVTATLSQLVGKAIIDRFDRYPHRNEVIGRKSTPVEIEFLKEHTGF
jgi:Na+-driven multidrug efflux pump